MLPGQVQPRCPVGNCVRGRLREGHWICRACQPLVPRFTVAMLELAYTDFMATTDDADAQFFLGEWFSWKAAAIQQAGFERYYRAHPHRRPGEGYRGTAPTTPA